MVLIRLSLVALLIVWAWSSTSVPVLIALIYLSLQNEALGAASRELRQILRDVGDDVQSALRLLDASARMNRVSSLVGWVQSERELRH